MTAPPKWVGQSAVPSAALIINIAPHYGEVCDAFRPSWRNVEARPRQAAGAAEAIGNRFGGRLFISKDHQFRVLRFRGLCPAKSNLGRGVSL